MPHGVYRRILDLAGCIVYHLGMVGENESRKGDLTRREFLTGAAVTAAGAVLTACKPGPIAEKAIKEAQATATVWAKKEEARKAAISAEGKTREAPLNDIKKEINEALVQRKALGEVLHQHLGPRGWRVEMVDFVGGDADPLKTENDVVIDKEGLNVRSLPVDDDPQTKIVSLRKDKTLRGTKFKVTVYSPENIRYVWGVITPTDIKTDPDILLPDVPAPFSVRDELNTEQKYDFFCLREGDKTYAVPQ